MAGREKSRERGFATIGPRHTRMPIRPVAFFTVSLLVKNIAPGPTGQSSWAPHACYSSGKKAGENKWDLPVISESKFLRVLCSKIVGVIIISFFSNLRNNSTLSLGNQLIAQRGFNRNEILAFVFIPSEYPVTVFKVCRVR